jgi:RNA polymerase sigma-70 factor, ECF subfamily
MMSDERTPADQPAAEADLVIRAKSDRNAFGQLYDLYYPRVARYCLRRLFDRTVAEDVVSEVFLQVSTHLRGFPGTTETDFRCWLFRIATNAVNAHLRQTLRRKQLWDAAANRRQWESGNGNHSSVTEHELLDWPTLYQAILELEERDQTILMLRFFSECSFEDIAIVIHATSGAVRTALSRVLSRLRARFHTAGAPLPVLGPTERGE